MKIIVDARALNDSICSHFKVEQTDRRFEAEIPDDLSKFFESIYELGRFSLIPPFSTNSFPYNDTELWMLFFENEYD